MENKNTNLEEAEALAEMPEVEAVMGDGAAVAPAKKRKKPINQQKLQDNLWGWLFCTPLIVGTTLFVYIAFVIAILLSFSNYQEATPLWNFLGNIEWGSAAIVRVESGEFITDTSLIWYRYIFESTTQSNDFWYTLFNTVFYLIGIPIGMILSVFFAVCMSRDIKGANIFRVIYYIPCVASTVAITYTFQRLFATGGSGVINRLLFGDDSTRYINWLNGAQNTRPWSSGAIIYKWVIIIMSVWKGLGGTIILYVAGLSGVNASHKEAASIDGANAWITFWKIEIPQLWPTIFYNMVTAVIGGMQIYTEPDLLFSTNGGVNFEVTPYVGKIFYLGPMGNNPSPNCAYACALGIILALIIFVLTLFQFLIDSKMDK